MLHSNSQRTIIPPLTCKLFVFSIFLIHLLACPWGSIIKGQRLALNTIIPLSTENESVGNPSIFHCLIRTASPNFIVIYSIVSFYICAIMYTYTRTTEVYMNIIPKVEANVGVSEHGIWQSIIACNQIDICFCRYTAVNGPK